MAMKIFGFPPSTYTQTVLMVAAEVGAEVELEGLAFRQASHFERHPFGKMPALEDGDMRLFETLAIATYLDGRANGGLVPSDLVARARMMQWVSAAIDYLYPALVGGLHDDEPGGEALTAAAEGLKQLDAGLGDGPFFAGKLSLADFVLFPMARFALGKLGADAPAGLGSLAGWRDRMATRESVKRAAA